MAKLKIMSLNAGYFTGVSGSTVEYVTKFDRILYAHHYAKHEVTDKVIELIENENPDILYISELRHDIHSHRIGSLFRSSKIYEKYAPESGYRHLPRFAGNANGVFLKRDWHVEHFYLKNGTKRLVHKVRVQDDLVLFFAHFALGARARRAQFEEIAREVAREKRAVLAGDCNTFGGYSELIALCQRGNLHILNDPTEHTFPAVLPNKTIDLFLATPELSTSRVRVLNDALVSDHLPVVLDVTY